MVSPEGIEHLKQWRKTPAFGDPGNEFNLEGLRAGMGMRQEPANKDIRCTQIQIDGLSCEWVLAPGADPEVRLLYLHGGGFVSGSGGNYLPFAAELSVAAKCAVLLPDYGLAPEHPFPAAIEDCVHAHEWMLAHSPTGPKRAKATFIAGDSAGGGLTLATVLALRDRRLTLPLGAMPLSACTDLTLASESMRTEPDPVCSVRAMPMFIAHYLGQADPRHPLASPIFADFTGIPPLLLQVGQHEMLRDDSVRLAAKAQAAGIDVTLEVWPGMVHVFQIRGLPESREAIAHLAAFMHKHLARR